MKYVLAFHVAVLAVTALPVEFYDERDPARAPGAFTSNVNYTTARVPWGQAGFASMNGGTHGGNGGAVWTVWDPWALRDAVSGNERREIYIRGRLDLKLMFTGSPGVRFNVGNYKSIYGGDSNAMIYGGGLVLSNVRQIIIQDLKFHNALNYAPGELPDGNGGIIGQIPGSFSTIDSVGIQSQTEYVWIHHCEFADDPWNSVRPENQRRHDGLIDIVQGASMVSISNCLFRNHDMVSLIGNDDNNAWMDSGRLKVTFYHNWFQAVNQRNPRVRYGEVHLVNNLYTNIRTYAVGIGTGALIYAERNSFHNTRRAWRYAAGVPSPPGYILNVENRLDSNSNHESIPSYGVTWRPSNYYPFAAMIANDVEAYVRRYAGTRL